MMYHFRKAVGTILAIFTLFFLLCTNNAHTGAFKKPGENDDGEIKTADKNEFDAIAQLHKSMDDDLSGGIDPNESSDFLREELHVKDKDPLTRRQKTFHHNNDDSITVNDLWERWSDSEERKWSMDDIRDWLVRYVELPQYADTFYRNGIDGSRLPRLALQNTSFMQTVLGITNPVHRQKLQLKAMDVVLFGYRSAKPSYGKDILLVTLLVAAVGAYWFAMHQRTASQKHAHALNAQLGKLKDMEQEFVILQNQLEEEKGKQDSCKASIVDDDYENREDLESLKQQLLEAERKRERRSPLLMSLLRKTYELEVGRINRQKLESFKEMNEAREMVEKLRKKQSSLLNQIRSVHGAETEIDDRILIVRQKMEKTARSIEECEHRWLEIESLIGFKIVNYSASSNIPLVPGLLSRPLLYGGGLGSMDLVVDNDIPASYALSADNSAHYNGQFGDGGTPRVASYPHRLAAMIPGSNLSLARTTINKSSTTTTAILNPSASSAAMMMNPIGLSSGSGLRNDLATSASNTDCDTVLRSASTSDLGATTNVMTPSPAEEPGNGPARTTNGGSSSEAAADQISMTSSRQQPLLAAVGKLGSQGSSIGANSNTSQQTVPITKTKKKTLLGGIFSRDKNKE